MANESLIEYIERKINELQIRLNEMLEEIKSLEEELERIARARENENLRS